MISLPSADPASRHPRFFLVIPAFAGMTRKKRGDQERRGRPFLLCLAVLSWFIGIGIARAIPV
jgi:nitric oxide reductase large subunit